MDTAINRTEKYKSVVIFGMARRETWSLGVLRRSGEYLIDLQTTETLAIICSIHKSRIRSATGEGKYL